MVIRMNLCRNVGHAHALRRTVLDALLYAAVDFGTHNQRQKHGHGKQAGQNERSNHAAAAPLHG